MSDALPPRVRELLISLVPVICPPEAMELRIAADVADHVGLTAGAMPRLLRAAFFLGLRTYDEGARAWPPARGRAARALAPELAERYYQRWEHGATAVQTQLAKAMAQVLKLAHYEHPRVQARMGYRPAAWIETVKQRRLATYGDAVRAAEAAVIVPDPLRPAGHVDRSPSPSAAITPTPAPAASTAASRADGARRSES